MNRTKKLVVLLLSFIMLLSISVNATEVESQGTIGIIDFSNIENNPNVSVSEVLTFSEMVERYAKNAGITYWEALEMFPNASSTYSARGVYYREFTVTLDVDKKYKPSLKFYCETAEGGNFRNINAIYSVQLVREYNGKSKQFSGDIQVWLRNTYAIEYVVNGDFYNNGTTTFSGGGNGKFGIAEIIDLTFTASFTYVSNHYKYFYVHDTAVYGAG